MGIVKKPSSICALSQDTRPVTGPPPKIIIVDEWDDRNNRGMKENSKIAYLYANPECLEVATISAPSGRRGVARFDDHQFVVADPVQPVLPGRLVFRRSMACDGLFQ